MTKPKGLLLPPDCINNTEFQRLLIDDWTRLAFKRNISSEELKLWYLVLVKTLDKRSSYRFKEFPDDKKLYLIKNLCLNIKGLHSFVESIPTIDKHLLYLENLSNIPRNVFDNEFIKDLIKKYNYDKNCVITYHSDTQYVLLDTYYTFFGDSYDY